MAPYVVIICITLQITTALGIIYYAKGFFSRLSIGATFGSVSCSIITGIQGLSHGVGLTYEISMPTCITSVNVFGLAIFESSNFFVGGFRVDRRSGIVPGVALFRHLIG